MAYIGREPQIGNFQVCDAISVVNGQAAYTMQVGGANVSPETANHMLVSLNGVLQAPGSSYTVSGSTITFASNLVTGDVIDFIHILGSVLDLGVPSDSTVSLAKLTATGTKSSSTFLRGDNTFAEAGGGAYTFIKSQTASNSASVEFKNGVSDVVLDGTYCHYFVIGYDVVAQTDDKNLQIQFSTDAGSSYITSGYDTIIDRRRADTSNAGERTATDCAMSLNSFGNNASAQKGDFKFELFNPSGTLKKSYFFNGTSIDHQGRVAHHDGGGMYETNGDVDAIKIFFDSGNIVSGIFKLYGLTGA